MADKKYVGTFQSEHQVLNMIEELKAEGYTEDDIYIVTNDTDSLSIVRGQTDVELKSSEGNWLNRFIAFLSGDEPVKAAFSHMGFTDEESTRYYNEVKNGCILLYVDRNYSGLFYDQQLEFQNGYTDPNIGANLTTDSLDNIVLGNGGVNVDTDHEERLRLHEEANIDTTDDDVVNKFDARVNRVSETDRQ